MKVTLSDDEKVGGAAGPAAGGVSAGGGIPTTQGQSRVGLIIAIVLAVLVVAGAVVKFGILKG